MSGHLNRALRVALTLALTIFMGGLTIVLDHSDHSTSSRTRARTSRPLQPPLVELSGLARHLSEPELYWSHNDSLDEARVFLVHRSGELIREYPALQSGGDPIINIDWEAMGVASQDPHDGARVLYVADSGNNFHWRDDLLVYAFREPHLDDESLELIRIYPYRFPEQRRDPPRSYDPMRGRCLDSEALFWWRDDLYLIGKCVRGGPAPLWRLPRRRQTFSLPRKPKESVQHNRTHSALRNVRAPQVTLEHIALLPITEGSHPLHERVTGAAIREIDEGDERVMSERGALLAILTYRSVWLFELSQKPHAPPELKLRFSCPLTLVTPPHPQQAEAIEWSAADELIIFTEGQGIHTLRLDLERERCVDRSLTP